MRDARLGPPFAARPSRGFTPCIRLGCTFCSQPGYLSRPCALSAGPQACTSGGEAPPRGAVAWQARRPHAGFTFSSLYHPGLGAESAPGPPAAVHAGQPWPAGARYSRKRRRMMPARSWGPAESGLLYCPNWGPNFPTNNFEGQDGSETHMHSPAGVEKRSNG